MSEPSRGTDEIHKIFCKELWRLITSDQGRPPSPGWIITPTYGPIYLLQENFDEKLQKDGDLANGGHYFVTKGNVRKRAFGAIHAPPNAQPPRFCKPFPRQCQKPSTRSGRCSRDKPKRSAHERANSEKEGELG